MDRRVLARIDDELDSSEVAELRFLCRDTISKRKLEGISNAKELFDKLDEKGLLANRFFLSHLLQTIRRADLLSHLETDSGPFEETDAKPLLSDYRVMLYEVYQDITQANFDKMKFLLRDELTRVQTDKCNTTLDLFAEMEKAGLLSNTNLGKVHETLLEVDQRMAERVQRYKVVNQQPRSTLPIPKDDQIINNPARPDPASLVPVRSGTRPISVSDERMTVITDSQPSNKPSLRSDRYYSLDRIPRGICMIINNETFVELKLRRGTKEDEKTLRSVFYQLGFTVEVRSNLTAGDMKRELKNLGSRNFLEDDVLVVCILSHGGKDCVYGSDENKVSLGELTQPFTSLSAPTLAGKPKLFFIQACQGKDYQKGNVPCPPKPPQEVALIESRLEEDAGPVNGEKVPDLADILMGMATVPNCQSFRNIKEGSIYIQELCKQLMDSARSEEMEDILSILTSVNREVSRGEYNKHKQMPEPKYTLTKKLVLKWVRADPQAPKQY